MAWQALVGAKLVSPEEAVRPVRSGETVAVAPLHTTPVTLCRALMARQGELEGVQIDHLAPLFDWCPPGAERAFRPYNNYASPADRGAVRAGQVEYVPYARWRSYEVPDGFAAAPDHFFVPVSPPDHHGYCSLGLGAWLSRAYAAASRRVVAEVHAGFIRTGGENYLHVSEIDVFVEAAAPAPAPAPGQLPEHEATAVEVICSLVAAELVHDRETLQLGIGTVSGALGLFLDDKRDLGVMTEIITAGVPDLVRKGVVTGKYKTDRPWKVTGSAILGPGADELAFIDGNPTFELYDFGYTDDLRRLIQTPNFVTINNALQVDLTGQIAAETIGPLIHTGVGGQTVFMVAGHYSPGGRAISVTPATSLVNGRLVSRIVAGLEPGAAVTVPRTLVDYLVTEYGIATLRGKSLRQRIAEIIAVAHPDFQPELREAARRLYGAQAPE